MNKVETGKIYQKLEEIRKDLYKGFRVPEPEDVIAIIDSAIDDIEDVQDMVIDLEDK